MGPRGQRQGRKRRRGEGAGVYLEPELELVLRPVKFRYYAIDLEFVVVCACLDRRLPLVFWSSGGLWSDSLLCPSFSSVCGSLSEDP